MKRYLFLLGLIWPLKIFPQCTFGWEKEEVKNMVAICNSFPFIDLYKSDSLILPKGYAKQYTSPVMGMDNMYQVYTKDKVAIINLRGSTAKRISWLANIYSAMIPAKGRMVIGKKAYRYNFAKSPSAAVHAGYALALICLSEDILQQIKLLNEQDIYHFIITGHSQGGALANLLRAYLENLPSKKVSSKNFYKTYSFAAPMVGNKFFSDEYSKRYAAKNTSFNIINPADPIPKFPLSYNEKNSISENMKTFYNDYESFKLKEVLSDGLVILFEGSISKSVKMFSGSVKEQISKELGPFELPAYIQNFNYKKLENQVEISPVAYPKMLKDSTVLEEEFYKKFYKKGEDGQYLKKSLYVKEPWTYQHKPYNYYTSILNLYFPEDYILLEKKFLQENLK